MEGMASIALLLDGSILGHFVQLPKSVYYQMGQSRLFVSTSYLSVKQPMTPTPPSAILLKQLVFLLYYRRVEEGKQYPLLCRRLASLNEEFISHKSPTGGFDFISRKRIEQKLIDYNQEAERFGVMHMKRDLNLGSLCSKPQADWVCNVAWAKGGQGISSQAACFKKARDDLYKVKAWVFSPQVKVIRSDIREEDVLKEKDAFEDLKKLAAKSLTETVNQLIDTVNQGQNRSGAPLKAADNVIISQHQHAAASQIQARETDIHALSLSKNETGVPMNVSESFKKEYAMVLLQLKEASDQVASALANLRRRNTYPEPTSRIGVWRAVWSFIYFNSLELVVRQSSGDITLLAVIPFCPFL
ncbi:unnamed protein product [Lactuca saligna]|uniref:Uncharacterized protein n=1 Tax=Lactuca saligna TaxID=75948 RepID=A0AA35VU02_LACSI|nr:unnamed protein product [Lactuca saligna]